MIESGSFNIVNTETPTNDSMVVTFSPAINTKTYKYTVYKDGKVINEKIINSNSATNINLVESGSYQISVLVDNTNTVTSGTYVIDKQAPTITTNKTSIDIYKNKEFNVMEGVTATDNTDGDLTNKVTTNINELNLNEKGQKVLTYTVSDTAGNVTTKDVVLNVNGSYLNLIIFWIVIAIAFIFLVSYIIKIGKSFKLEKRIEKYTLNPKDNKSLSIVDSIILVYQNFIKDFTNILKKSVILSKYAKKLDKYTASGYIHETGMELVGGKIVMAALFIIMATFTKAIKFKVMSSYEIALPCIVGFFMLDIIYIIKYYFYKNKLENDLLSAITVMNNAFESGRSIIQAIEIVPKEVKGPIGKEFEKMGLELSYGLSIEEVFKRFSRRIKIEEVNYLTASLSVLNKTGGNIVEVFNSIEKSMFNKKKLRTELKSLTGSSRLIVYILLAVPFLFVICISIISPDYFLPFINTKLGLILLCIMIAYYILFVICVRKIMKVVI